MNRTDRSMIFLNESYKGGYLKGGLIYKAPGPGEFIKQCRNKGFDVQGIIFDPESDICELLHVYKEEI